ncbi:MAG: EamA family transporter [Salinisphaeraceae bacterium]|nr:EamA family transporter [Salinisphaeraceae bacterium]
MKGPILVALAAACWGLSGGIAGVLLEAGWSPFVIAFYRGAIGLGFFVVWLALTPGPRGLGSVRLWFWSVLAGAGVAGNFSFYFLSIGESSLAVAATLMYTAPVFVLLISFALPLEQPTAGKAMAMMLVLLGVALLTRLYDTSAGQISPAGVAAGLLSGLSYAVFIFGFKYAGTQGRAPAVLSVAFAALVCLLGWVADPAQIIAAPTSSQALLFILLGVIGGGLSFMLYLAGLRSATPAVASVVALVEPVVAALFGFTLLGEPMTASQFAGMALILATVTALAARQASGRD